MLFFLKLSVAAAAGSAAMEAVNHFKKRGGVKSRGIGKLIVLSILLLLFGVSDYSYGQELISFKCTLGKWGFRARKTKSVVINCEYDMVGKFHGGYAAVKFNGKWGIIDKTGKEVAPIKYGYTEIKNNSKALIEIYEKALIENFVTNYIAQELSKWRQKGEFERTADWQQRINEDNRKAKEAELLMEAEQAFIAGRSKDLPVGQIWLGAYDADREVFLIINSVHGDWLEPVPIHEAPDFKNNWNNLVKTPQYVIRNDQITLAGYKFEQKENQTVSAQQGEKMTVSTQETISVSSRQSKTAIGANLIIGEDGIGFGAKFTIGKQPPYTFRKTHLRMALEVERITGILWNFWNSGVYGHWVIPLGEKVAIYPLAGIGVFTGDVLGFDVGAQATCSFGGGIDIALGSKFMLHGEIRQKRLINSENIENTHFNSFSVGLAYKFLSR